MAKIRSNKTSLFTYMILAVVIACTLLILLELWSNVSDTLPENISVHTIHQISASPPGEWEYEFLPVTHREHLADPLELTKL